MHAVNILILRRIRPGREREFDDAVRRWIPSAIQHPGYLGVFLLEPGPSAGEHGALLRFQTIHDWERFRNWPAYQEFLARIRPLLADEPRVEALHGLEAWFRAAGREPPRWKMALLTWLGVNAMVWLVSETFASLELSRPAWLFFLLANALVVCGLTWIVMPLLSRLFAPWLRKEPA